MSLESSTFIFDILSYTILEAIAALHANTIVYILHSSLYCIIMNNVKRKEVLLKVIERIYEQHADMRDIIDSFLVDVCREENVSSEKVFSLFSGFIIMD